MLSKIVEIFLGSLLMSVVIILFFMVGAGTQRTYDEEEL
jgi:hypothetical protein